MGFSVVGTKKIGGSSTEYSIVPDAWVNETIGQVLFPRNRLKTLSKDENSQPDPKTWLPTQLVKLYMKGISLEKADHFLDNILDQSESELDDLPSKRLRLDLHHPKTLPVQKQYTLSAPHHGQTSYGVSLSIFICLS